MGTTLAFLDESGDTGRPQYGGSPLFAVSLVVFADDSSATRAEERIDHLRDRLQMPRLEFHIRKNAAETRRAFVEAVASLDFTYYAAVFQKGRQQREDGARLYLTACAQVLTVAATADPMLERVTVVYDEGTRDRVTQQRFATALRNSVNFAVGRAIVGKVRPRDSARSNLVQFADYVAGIITQDVQGKVGSDAPIYRQLLVAREGVVWLSQA